MEEGGEKVEEARKFKGYILPKAPTSEEVEDHNRIHLPFRSWCPHCFKGRAVNLAHRKGIQEEQEIPVISMDNMWMKEDKEGDSEERKGTIQYRHV